MAPRINVYIEGAEEKGPINLLASLSRLRQQLAEVDDTEHLTVTLTLSALFSARPLTSGGDWDPQGDWARAWRGGEWIDYAQNDTY